MIISKTPVRLSLFGGGTDYREYFDNNPGAVLGFTINKYVYVSINNLSDFFDYKIRVGYSKTELVDDIKLIQHPSVRETLKYLEYEKNLDIHIFADLPARTGLGSSSSFTVGFLNAMENMSGKSLSKKVLAESAIYIEQDLINENVGSQDQIHAAYGGVNLIEFGVNGFNVSSVALPRDRVKSLNDSLMVFYTRQTRYATNVIKQQIENTASNKNDQFLKIMYEMVFEGQNILKNSPFDDFIQELGCLLDKGWKLKKQLSSKVSNKFIDDAYDSAIKAGAYGGKLAGAGSGGFLFFLVPDDKKDRVRKSLKNLLEVEVEISFEGSKIIYFND
jgi:D-glycero-alpha-D-manno-heptose-7-phosphate kinase